MNKFLNAIALLTRLSLWAILWGSLAAIICILAPLLIGALGLAVAVSKLFLEESL